MRRLYATLKVKLVSVVARRRLAKLRRRIDDPCGGGDGGVSGGPQPTRPSGSFEQLGRKDFVSTGDSRVRVCRGVR